MIEFLSMGGYAGWIWPAYGFTALVLIIMIVASMRFARNQRLATERLQSATRSNENTI